MKVPKLNAHKDKERNSTMNQEAVEFISMLRVAVQAYVAAGCSSRSPARVNIVHKFFLDKIESSLPEGYSVNLEQNVLAVNAAGRKKCDIVVSKGSTPHVVFPVKFIMGNYQQNKNNYFENLTGELCHLKWATGINICPINIVFNKIPYRNNQKIITKFEVMEYDKTLRVYEQLVNNGLCEDIVNYIIGVEWNDGIGEFITQPPTITGFNKHTPYVPMARLLEKLL